MSLSPPILSPLPRVRKPSSPRIIREKKTKKARYATCLVLSRDGLSLFSLPSLHRVGVAAVTILLRTAQVEDVVTPGVARRVSVRGRGGRRNESICQKKTKQEKDDCMMSWLFTGSAPFALCICKRDFLTNAQKRMVHNGHWMWRLVSNTPEKATRNIYGAESQNPM